MTPAILLAGEFVGRADNPYAGFQPVQSVYSTIDAIRANTSSTMVWGTLSSLWPWRAPRSSARGWSQRTTPVVTVPAPVKATAKPAVRANFPPLVIGTTIGARVARLKASGETINTGRRPFARGLRPDPAQPARLHRVSSDQLAAGRFSTYPLPIPFAACRFRRNLGEQAIHCIMRPFFGFHHQAPALDRNADPRPRPQSQQRRRNRQHHRSTDFTQIGRLHVKHQTIFLYNWCKAGLRPAKRRLSHRHALQRLHPVA